jgi:Flp pilus assembly protein TadG
MPYRLPSVLKRFHRASGGNVGIILALSAIPLLVAAGGAIDYSRASDAKSQMAQALDAAALAVGSSPELSNADMKKLALKYFRENYPDAAPDVDIAVTVNNSRIRLSVQSEVPTTLLQVVGYKKIPVSITNEVTRSANNVEVALALDVTGSMKDQNKIQDLKDAAKLLIDIVVQDNQSPWYSKVAIAPYSMAVNVGGDANILRGALTAGTCAVPGCESFKFTDVHGDSQTFSASTCVTERTGAEAYSDVAPDPLKPDTQLGLNYPNSSGSCLSSTIMPLSSDRTALKNKIDSFVPKGWTAGHIGVTWARYLLSPNFGFLWPAASKPAPYGAGNLIKTAVIMTDGLFNTAYCNGVIAKDSEGPVIDCNATNGTSSIQALKQCDAMKAAGIVVYTVGFKLQSEPDAKVLLEKCATSPDHAFDANNGVQLKDVFKKIGNDISQLRLTH